MVNDKRTRDPRVSFALEFFPLWGSIKRLKSNLHIMAMVLIFNSFDLFLAHYKVVFLESSTFEKVYDFCLMVDQTSQLQAIKSMPFGKRKLPMAKSQK